jgi:hypothetical protein
VVAVAASADTQNPVVDTYTGLTRGARQLQDSWDLLNTAFSPERYSATANIIRQVENAKRMDWAARFSPPTPSD